MPTNPGLHSSFDIAKYSGTNRQAIRRIAESFYVTRGFEPELVGNSSYSAILVRPTDETSVYLNTDRELLVVLADYETFEIRTLEAFDRFYELLELKRVDTSIRFLVSSDDRIESSISQYLSHNPEYPIIIPITYDRLQRHVNPLITAVRQNYVIRDLFGYQAPLRQEHFFFGRQGVVNTVLDLAKSGQNSSLFGLRKSGKTSTIFAIRRKSKAFDITTVQIDCQSPLVHGRRFDELLLYVHNEVAKTTGSRPLKVVSGLSVVEATEQFSVAMTDLLARSKTSILLIFDEIEQISPITAASEHWRSGKDTVLFWQVIRSFYQTNANGKLSMCIVGTSPTLLETPKLEGIDNPVYLFAQKMFIPNLDDGEVRLMIKRLGFFMGLNFSDAIMSQLIDKYAGHPFFTRQVCSKVHSLASKNRPIEISLKAVREAEAAFESDLEIYVTDIIRNMQSLYPAEYALLENVALGDSREFNEFAAEAPELVDHLLGYGLIAKRENDFEITFGAIRPAVMKLQKVLPDRDTRWSQINIRRNTLEQGVRTALFYWSHGVTSEDWRCILQASISARNFEALASIEPSLLFSRNSSPLYLTDLAALLKDPRVLPHLAPRRPGIVKALFEINSLRRDAHARDFSDQEFENACNALEIVEANFQAP